MKAFNQFSDYWESLTPEQKECLAVRVVDSKTPKNAVNYLCRVAKGHRNIGAKIGRRMIEADPNLTWEMIFPKTA